MTDRTALPPDQYLMWAADQLASNEMVEIGALAKGLASCAQAYERLDAKLSEMGQEMALWEERAFRSSLYLKEVTEESAALQSHIQVLREVLANVMGDDSARPETVRQARAALARDPVSCLRSVREEAVMEAVARVRIAYGGARSVPPEVENVLAMVLTEARIQVS